MKADQHLIAVQRTAFLVASGANQVTGEKSEYYITLAQLDSILQKVKDELRSTLFAKS